MEDNQYMNLNCESQYKRTQNITQDSFGIYTPLLKIDLNLRFDYIRYELQTLLLPLPLPPPLPTCLPLSLPLPLPLPLTLSLSLPLPLLLLLPLLLPLSLLLLLLLPLLRHCHHYNHFQNPSGFCFPVQIKLFI